MLKVKNKDLFKDKFVIPNVSKCKILGTTICQKNYNRDMKEHDGYASANILVRRISKCSTAVKCYLFKTYCSNLIILCSLVV